VAYPITPVLNVVVPGVSVAEERIMPQASPDVEMLLPFCDMGECNSSGTCSNFQFEDAMMNCCYCDCPNGYERNCGVGECECTTVIPRSSAEEQHRSATVFGVPVGLFVVFLATVALTTLNLAICLVCRRRSHFPNIAGELPEMDFAHSTATTNSIEIAPQKVHSGYWSSPPLSQKQVLRSPTPSSAAEPDFEGDQTWAIPPRKLAPVQPKSGKLKHILEAQQLNERNILAVHKSFSR
jgi:hypothetical protein